MSCPSARRYALFFVPSFDINSQSKLRDPIVAYFSRSALSFFGKLFISEISEIPCTRTQFQICLALYFGCPQDCRISSSSFCGIVCKLIIFAVCSSDVLRVLHNVVAKRDRSVRDPLEGRARVPQAFANWTSWEGERRQKDRQNITRIVVTFSVVDTPFIGIKSGPR